MSGDIPRIRVDFNNLIRGGKVLGSQRRLSVGPRVGVGDTVIAEDPTEGMESTATVIEASTMTNLVVLDMHWEPATPV